jgi:PilZ domain
MHADAVTDFSHGAVTLQPIMVPVRAGADTVYVALLRYASSPVPPPSGARWHAVRPSNEQAVTFTLKDGPLVYMRMRFAVEPVEPPDPQTTVLWVTVEYTPRPSRLSGALERWRAQRDATSLRDEVLTMLLHVNEEQAPLAGHYVRSAERHDVRAPARLVVGDRSWRAEVLNVSVGGISLIVATSPGAAETDIHEMLDLGKGEVEILVQRESGRARVLVRHAVPSRGGVQVGLQVLDPDATRPLLQRAIARAGSGRLTPPSGRLVPPSD